MIVQQIAAQLKETTNLRVQSQFHIEETGQAYLFNGTAGEVIKNGLPDNYNRFAVREVRYYEAKEAFILTID